jgi:hypothetical protein
MIRLRALLVAVAVGSLVPLARCALEPATGPVVAVRVDELLRDPGHFDGRAVSFRATVVDRVSVLGVGAYRVASDGGDTLVVLGLRTAPRAGESTTISGTFRMAATIGALQAPVVVAR